MDELRQAANTEREVPLHEQLESVPENARLVIDSEDGLSTQYIPIGTLCKRAAQALRQTLNHPAKLEWFDAPTTVEWGETMICAAVDIDDNNYFDVYCERWQKENVELILGAAKRKWKGLTEKQVEEIAEYHGMDGLYETSVIDFYRAIELTLKEMNT